MSKRSVHYMALITFPRVGESCILLPYDHPNCTNQGIPAQTSPVVDISQFNTNGTFETENSIYVRFGSNKPPEPAIDKTECKEW